MAVTHARPTALVAAVALLALLASGAGATPQQGRGVVYSAGPSLHDSRPGAEGTPATQAQPHPRRLARKRSRAAHQHRWVSLGVRGGATLPSPASTPPCPEATAQSGCADTAAAAAAEDATPTTAAAGAGEAQPVQPCGPPRRMSVPAVYGWDGEGGGEGNCFTRFVSECSLPTRRGTFRLRAYSYEGPTKCLEPVAIIAGDIGDGEDVPVRVHDQCLTSEVLGSLRCDCREQLELSMDYIHRHGGVVIYMQQEGRGIGLANKIAAYALQDGGLDTVDANRHLGFEDDHRSYEAVEFILRDLGIKSVQLMTNNPFKLKALKAMGVPVHTRIPMLVPPNPHSERYLLAKSRRMSHLLVLDVTDEVPPAPVAPVPVVAAQPAAAAVAEALAAKKAAAGGGGAAVAAAVVAADAPLSTIRGGAAPGDFESWEDDGLREAWAFGHDSVVAAIEAVRAGKLVVVTDDEDRENEGDLICAGNMATEDLMAFMIRYTSGVICVSMEGERLDELGIPPMVAVNEDPKATAFAVTVDAKRGTTTGISAADRSNTIMTLSRSDSRPDDFNRPGHIFPLRYRKGGVLQRPGHTEAALDLSRLAGLPPVGVLCEITTADGRSMARLPELREFCKEHGLVLTSIRDMRCYLRERLRAQRPC